MSLNTNSVRVVKSELSDTTASAAAATLATIDCSLIRQQAAAEGIFFDKWEKMNACANKVRLCRTFVIIFASKTFLAGTTQFLEIYTSLISQSRTGVFIDVGSNMGGYFERMHAQLLEHPEWKVIEFEPNPKVCR